MGSYIKLCDFDNLINRYCVQKTSMPLEHYSGAHNVCIYVKQINGNQYYLAIYLGSRAESGVM